MSSFILLTAKGAIKLSTLDDLSNGVEAALCKSLKRAKAPALVGSWTWQKYKLFLYGYKDGRSGTENKNELPPPHDSLVLFGDCCVIASLDKSAEKPAQFTVEQYKKFYNVRFGGQEDPDDKDKEDEDEEEEEEEEDDDEVEEDYDDDGVEEDDDGEVIEEEEEEEEQKPTLRVKASAGFKKIAKWMYSAELEAEPYVL